MKLNLSNLVELEFFENEQVLYARWPDNDPFMPRDFEHTFTVVMNTLSRLELKKLIIDSGSNRNNLSDEDYKYISELLFSGLVHSGIEKVARIVSPFAGIQEKFKKYNKQIRDGMGATFELRNFENIETALRWLSES